MKKILYLLIIVLIASIAIIDSTAYYRRTAINGRGNGPGQPSTYAEIYIWRDVWGTDIYCKNSGGESCPWSVVGQGRDGSPKTIAEQTCVDHARNEIQIGNLNGNWTDPNTNHTVIWTYQSVGDSSRVTITGPGEQLPD